MLEKDSVKSRLESTQGISFTEFSYMLLQGYDYFHLNQHHGCVLQLGGSDQWGNITAGMSLIHYKSGREAYGMTIPLLTNAAGEKIGKSTGAPIWLSASKTSVYEFYQYFVRMDDADMERFLKFFTFLPLQEISDVMNTHQRDPSKRHAQRILAQRVTEFVHGSEAMMRAKTSAENIFEGGDITKSKYADLEDVFRDLPKFEKKMADIDGKDLVSLAVEIAASDSKGNAKKLIQNGGMYLNNRKIDDIKYKISSQDVLDGFFLIRSGKKNLFVIRIVE